MSRRNNRQRRQSRKTRIRSEPSVERHPEPFDVAVSLGRHLQTLGRMRFRNGDRPFADLAWGPVTHVEPTNTDPGGELRRKTEAMLAEQTSKQRAN
jgi:hypothetical protein